MIRRLAFIALLLAPAAAGAQTPLAAPGQSGWTPVGNDCFVWNRTPGTDETATWSGACENRRTSGKGVLIWRSQGNEQRYDGEMKDGKLNGHGIYSFGDGGRYEGDFKDDEFNGTGTLIDGSNRYDGGWDMGKKNGHGVLITETGARYDGDFKDNALEGQGTFTLPDQRRFEGALRHGLPNGPGKLTDPSGTVEGNWVDGCFNDGTHKASFIADPKTCK